MPVCRLRVALASAAVALGAACSAAPAAERVEPAAAAQPRSIFVGGPGPIGAPPPQRERLVVSGAGDVNLDPSYIPALRAEGYDHAWSGLGGLFVEDDLTVVNLECPVSTVGTIEPKEFNFRCDPAALPPARDAGVEVANLANNHVRDFGVEAMLDSVTQLRAAGITPVGVGPDAAAANLPAVLDVGGWRVAVLGFGGVVPAPDWLATPTRPGMADGDDTASMVAAVRAADEAADLVFVSIHWGVELDTEPRPEDVARAEAMIDAGADGIFGHHAHRLQPMGTYKDRPIAWGLGNFVWPNFSAAGSRSAVAQFVVERDGSVRGCLLPATITSPGHPELIGARAC
jgi:poly-gamma-glutamate synthesis protein (capsule biosynthesis protein)